MACGIRFSLGSTPARCARLRSAIAAPLRKAWRQLRTSIAQRRQDDLTDLGDRPLKDIGVIRERDIGLSRPADARDVTKLFWPP